MTTAPTAAFTETVTGASVSFDGISGARRRGVFVSAPPMWCPVKTKPLAVFAK